MSGTTGRRVRAALIGAAATAALMGSEAQALPIGDGVPVGQIGVQLYSFNTYVGGDRVKLEGILQALQAATLVNAQMLMKDKQIGQVAVGFDADLVVVERNPLESVGTLQDPLLVISNGRVGLDRLNFARSAGKN